MTVWRVFLVILIPWLWACAPAGSGFKTREETWEPAPLAQPAPSPTPETEVTTPVPSKGLTAEQRAKILSEGVWSHLPPKAGITGEMEYHEFTTRLTYGRVLEAISKVVRDLVPRVCEAAGLADGGARYHREEYPCGSILNSDWKKLLDLDIPEMRGKEDGVEYKIPGFTAPLLLARDNFSGATVTDNLDFKAARERRTSKAPGEDIELRFRPAGGQMAVDVCVHVPGTALTSPARTIKVSGKKKVLFVNISLSTDVGVRFGEVRFSYGRVCATSHVALNPATLQPSIRLAELEEPRLHDVRLVGTKITFKDWWARLLDKVASWFGLNIRKEIINRAQKEVSAISDDDFPTGKWLAKIASGLLGKKHAREINKVLVDRLSGKELPVTSIESREVLRRHCQLKSILDPRLAKWLTPEMCEQLIDLMDIRFSPFYRPSSEEELGCYRHFALLHGARNANGTKKWWAERCSITSRLVIGVPRLDADRLVDLLEQIVKDFVDNEIPEELRKLLKERGLPVAELLRRLDKAVKERRAPRDLKELLELI